MSDESEHAFRATWLNANNAPKDWVVLTISEIATLRAELAKSNEEAESLRNELTGGVHSCHDACQRPACLFRRERDAALAELAKVKSDQCGVVAEASRQVEASDSLYRKACSERDAALAQLAVARMHFKSACKCWADDDTAIKAICEKAGIVTENTGDYFKDATECVELLAEKLVTARADSDRIDWLERVGKQTVGYPHQFMFPRVTSLKAHDSLRAAIDATKEGGQ